MRKTILTLFVFALLGLSKQASARELSSRDLRDIDGIAVQLVEHAKELHDEYHEHLEGVRHSEKLEKDVSQLEKIGESLHHFAHDASISEKTMRRLRSDTNEILLLGMQIERTIELADPWVRASHGHRGIRHMRSAARDVFRAARRIDSFLPVDTEVIDGQVERLEDAVKELHDEFHEHLEGYEVSRHLDEDLEDLEKQVKHLHDLTHGKRWGEINLRHVSDDIHEILKETSHIEGLFVRQSRIGVRTRDWVGIEHSRDAITDVLASAGLLDHMIRKSDPNAAGPPHRSRFDRDHDRGHDRWDDRHRPRRDRHDAHRHDDDHHDDHHRDDHDHDRR